MNLLNYVKVSSAERKFKKSIEKAGVDFNTLFENEFYKRYDNKYYNSVSDDTFALLITADYLGFVGHIEKMYQNIYKNKTGKDIEINKLIDQIRRKHTNIQ